MCKGGYCDVLGPLSPVSDCCTGSDLALQAKEGREAGRLIHPGFVPSLAGSMPAQPSWQGSEEGIGGLCVLGGSSQFDIRPSRM